MKALTRPVRLAIVVIVFGIACVVGARWLLKDAAPAEVSPATRANVDRAETASASKAQAVTKHPSAIDDAPPPWAAASAAPRAAALPGDAAGTAAATASASPVRASEKPDASNVPHERRRRDLATALGH